MDKGYLFVESRSSICNVCGEQIQAKIIEKDGRIYILKTCVKHGEQENLLEEDSKYHWKKRDYDKPGTISKTQTKVHRGCPFDCGLCSSHDQHTCIGLIEVTDKCDLKCKICYSDSDADEDKAFLSLDKIEEMMEFFVECEGGSAEILQLSGGEPTLHPEILKIIEIARKKEIKYVMLNTNGLRIANDEAFVRSLSRFKGGFEVYLQFDSLKADVYMDSRGMDLLEIKKKAIDNLIKYNIPTTLVVTVQKGVNDEELGEIIQFGIENEGIRGVNFQPLAYFGRVSEDKLNKKHIEDNRVTLSGVINRIQNQLPDTIKEGDIIPLPCNVERVAVTYMMKLKGKFVPITRNIEVKNYLPLIDNTFAFDAERIVKKNKQRSDTDSLFKGCNCLNFMDEIKNFIPISFLTKSKKEKLEYVDKNTFRISISSFVDRYNFDIKSMQKECVHIITPDLKRIPFSAFNMFYRNGEIESIRKKSQEVKE